MNILPKSEDFSLNNGPITAGTPLNKGVAAGTPLT